MGRDVKRYFWYFHSFLDPRASVVLRQRRLSEAEACPAGAGGAPAGRGKLALELGEDKDLWSRTALAKAAFSRQRRQNGAGERHRCGRGFAHRSAIEMTILWAWDSRFCWS